jgi:predicted  nucleic acid-binding Zn-ribbon protein
MPTKLEEAIDLLQSDDGSNLSNAEAARRLQCSEAHIRRARAFVAAQQKSDELSDDPDDSARLLKNVVNSSEAVDLVDGAIADLKEELKELREQRKELGQRVKDAIHAARETHPLFDRDERSKAKSGNGKATLAAVG